MPVPTKPIPTTIPEAIELILRGFDEEEARLLIDDAPVDYGRGIVVRPSSSLHHGLMMALRNEWGMWDPDSALVQWTLKTYGVSMGDDVSGLIMDGFLAKLRGQVFDFAAAAESYKKHWREQGCDPATGQPLDGRNTTEVVDNTCLEIPYGATSRPGGMEAPRKRGKLRRLLDSLRG